MNTKQAARLAERDEARAELLKILKPGSTVYTICHHVSASGMLRIITAVTPGKGPDGKPAILGITDLVVKATGYRLSKRPKPYGILMPGCGYDAGFDIVYGLGLALWPKGTKRPHGTRNGEPDRNGGYALKHAWL